MRRSTAPYPFPPPLLVPGKEGETSGQSSSASSPTTISGAATDDLRSSSLSSALSNALTVSSMLPQRFNRFDARTSTPTKIRSCASTRGSLNAVLSLKTVCSNDAALLNWTSTPR